jgi:hypothetical protein
VADCYCYNDNLVPRVLIGYEVVTMSGYGAISIMIETVLILSEMIFHIDVSILEVKLYPA